MNQARILLKPNTEIIAVETVDNPTDEEAYELGKLIYENGCLGRFTELSEEQCAMLVTSIINPPYDDEPKLVRKVGYKDYNKYPGRWSKFQTAKESLQSALQAHNIDPDKALIIKISQ